MNFILSFFKSIKSTIIATMLSIVILITLVVVSITTVTNELEKSASKSKQTKLANYYEVILSELNNKSKSALTLATFVAEIPDVQKAFAARDRNALASIIQPTFQKMKKEYGVRQFQFHTAPATSFLRVHKPQKFGDDLSSFRHTVTKTNNTQTPVFGLEKGVAGIGIRGVVPVFSDGSHIGSVEFGLSFGQAFFDEFKKETGVDVIFKTINKDGSLKMFASTINNSFSLTDKQIKNIINNKQELIIDKTVEDKPITTYANIINDFSGKPIGVIQVISDNSTYIADKASINKKTIIMVSIIILLGLIVLTIVFLGLKGGLQNFAKRMDTNIMPNINNLFNEVAEVSKVSESIKSQSAETISEGEVMLANSKNATTSTSTVASATEELSASVVSVEEQVNHLGNIAKVVLNSSDEAYNQVTGLNQAVTSIGEVTSLINSIAEQTNLLALNASIEAARAGDAGRGFAVVADEVKKLSLQTAEATKNITEQIQQVQKSTEQTVASITVVKDKMDDMDNSINSVTEVTREQKIATDDIASSILEAADITENTLTRSQNVLEKAESTSISAQNIATSVNKVNNNTQQLKILVEDFIKELTNKK